jgi:hypothetical protein
MQAGKQTKQETAKMKTVKFVSMGRTIKTARVMNSETHAQAAARVGIDLQSRNDAAGTVFTACYREQNGEARFYN